MVRNPFTDQGLPHLVQFVDPVFMKERFQEVLRTDNPAYEVIGCKIEKISFRPDKHCSALFRINLCDQNQSEAEKWFFAKMYATGKGQQRFEKEKSKGQQVTFWSDWETLLWTFPYDSKLPQLHAFVQQKQILNLIEQQRPLLGLSPDAIIHQVVCKQIKYVPGKRCVLRFTVTFSEPQQESQRLQFYSKTFSDEQSRYVYETLEAVRANLGTQPNHFEVPKLLGHFEDLHTFWQIDWPSEPMARLYYRNNWPTVLPAIAQGLAAFHLSQIPNLQPAAYLDEIVSEVVGDAEWIADFVPSIGERALSLAAQIGQLEPAMRAAKQETAVPVHGAFRMSQLLYREEEGENGRIAMVDLDAIALGDPHYDVAEFMASTVYQYFHRDLNRAQLIELATQFSQLYAAQVPWPIHNKLLAWYMAASLLGKLRGSFKRIQFPAIAKTEELFEVVSFYLSEAETIE